MNDINKLFKHNLDGLEIQQIDKNKSINRITFLGECSLRNLRRYLEISNLIEVSKLNNRNINNISCISYALNRAKNGNYGETVIEENGLYREAIWDWIKTENRYEVLNQVRKYDSILVEEISKADIVHIGLVCTEHFLYKNIPLNIPFSHIDELYFKDLEPCEIEKELINIIKIIKTINRYAIIVFSISPVSLKYSNAGFNLIEADVISKAKYIIAIRSLESKYDFVYCMTYEFLKYVESFNVIRQKDNRHLNMNGQLILNEFYCDFIRKNFEASKYYSIPKVDQQGKIIGDINIYSSKYKNKFPFNKEVINGKLIYTRRVY